MTTPTISPLAAAVREALVGAAVPFTPTAITAELIAEPEKRRASAFDLVAAQPWAIQPATLEVIAQIARRENENPEAVAAKLGRPLQNTRTVSVRDGVAIVPVTGPIMRYANLFTQVSGATSLEVLARDFNAALNDSAIKAIVLEMDSPGGQASGIAEFAQMVRAATKPVIAYVDGMAASAAYWIAVAADEVVVSKTGTVGSIGTLVALDTRPQVGVMEIVSSQSPKKRVDVTTDEGRAQIQARIDELAHVFISDVATYRGVSVETVLANFGQGDVRMGAGAVTLGMADRVSTLDQVIAGLTGEQNGGQSMAIKKNGVVAAIENAAEGDVCQLEDGTEGIVKDGVCVPAEPATEPTEPPAAIAAKYRAEGVSQERTRIHALMHTPLANSYGALLASAIASGMTQGEFANAILTEEGKARGTTLATLRGGAQKPLAQPAAPDNGAPAASLDHLPVEERCKAEWESKPELRKEFSSLAAYTAYTNAMTNGQARIFGQK